MVEVMHLLCDHCYKNAAAPQFSQGMARLARHSMQIWLPFETYNIPDEARKSLDVPVMPVIALLVCQRTPDGEHERRGPATGPRDQQFYCCAVIMQLVQ